MPDNPLPPPKAPPAPPVAPKPVTPPPAAKPVGSPPTPPPPPKAPSPPKVLAAAPVGTRPVSSAAPKPPAASAPAKPSVGAPLPPPTLPAKPPMAAAPNKPPSVPAPVAVPATPPASTPVKAVAVPPPMKPAGGLPPKPLTGSPSQPPAPAPTGTPLTGRPPGMPATPPPAPKPPGITPPPAGVAKPAGPGASTPPGAPTPPPPQVATVKKSPLKFLPIIAGGLILVLVAAFALFRFFGSGSTTTTTTNPGTNTRPASPGTQTAAGKKVTVTYWGLWEPTAVMEEVITEFEKANPDINVDYIMQSPKDYRERLQTAVASGNGPDVFRFHASWVPMLKSELSQMPATVMSVSEYQQTFYPVMTKQLQVNGQVVGVPTQYEGLALYYNKEMLQTANAQPPSTWAELRTLATQLTVRSGNKIERGGMAIGNAANVDHFADILGLLMLQNGADPANPTSTEARDALTFYTNFMKVDKVWSAELPNSTVAFARGDVAMIMAPSWRVHEIKAMNPDLDFGIAPVPKLGETRVGWATYWAEGVSAQSKNKDAAWKFLKFLSTAEAQQALHNAQSKVRAFGTVYSRVDMANKLASHPYLGAYVDDAPTASGWYLNSSTHDGGLNDQLIKYYQDAINAVLGGKSATEALQTVNLGTGQVLRQYGITTTQSRASDGSN
jgi:multiple sugar transport system substrate-binding protein